MQLDQPIPLGDLLLAQSRAEHLAQHGATVIGPSLQAVFAGFSVLWALNAAIVDQPPAGLFWFLLAASGTVVCVVSWVRARTQHTLVASVQEPERPLVVLRKKDRTAIGRQMRGQEKTTPATAPLVRAMLHWQQRTTRAMTMSLAGLGLGLAGVAGTTIRSFQGWSLAVLVLELAAIVLGIVIALVRARQRRRVLATIETTQDALM